MSCSSKKRLREEEEGSDSLPLSKRINLLHLDSNTRFASLSSCFSFCVTCCLCFYHAND